MKKSHKHWLTVLVAIVAMLVPISVLFACGETYPDVPETPDTPTETDFTVSITGGNAFDCVEGQSLTLRAETSAAPDTCSWRSSDDVLSVVTNADGTATVTAGIVEEATAVTVTYTAARGDKIKEASCTVTVKPFDSTFSTTFRVAANDNAATAAFDREGGVYGYKETVGLRVTAAPGYFLSAVRACGRLWRFEDGAVTLEGDTFTASFINYAQTADSEVELLFDKITVSYVYDETAVEVTKPTGETYVIGGTYEVKATLVGDAAETSNLLLYVNGELIGAFKNGDTYGFRIEGVVTTVQFVVTSAETDVGFDVVRDADPSGTSKSGVLKAFYPNAVFLAKMTYAGALTDEEWQFGIRIYNGEQFDARLDIRLAGGAVTLLCSSDSAAVYTYADPAAARQALADGGLTVIVVRRGAAYTVLTEDGTGGIVPAFNVTLKGSDPYRRIGFGMQKNIDEGGSVACEIVYFDGATDWRAVMRGRVGDMQPSVHVTERDGDVTADIAGLSGTYRLGAEVSFTVTARAGYFIGSVRVNGVTVMPVNGVYTVVLDATRLQIDVETVTDNRAEVDMTRGNATVTFPVGTDLTALTIGDTLTFTVSAEDFYRVSRVLWNGVEITATDGVYTVTLVQRDNTLTVETESRVRQGVHRENAGEVRGVKAGDAPESILFVNLKFTGLADLMTADRTWCIDLRLRTTSSSGGFFALSMVWDGSHLYLSSRKASGVTFPDPTYVIGQLNTADGYNMVLVRNGAQLNVYVETAGNQLMHLATFETALDADGALYAIGYEANASVSGSLSKSEVETGRTRQISWVNYDGYTAADLVRIIARELGEETRVTEDERVTLDVSAGNSTVTFNPGINKDNLHGGDTLTFTVAPDDYATVTRVLFNGEEVTAADGVYTVTLTDGANTLTVETESRIYRGTHKVNGDEVRGVNAGSSAKSILFVNLKFTGLADILTEDNVWCIDLRLRTTSGSGGFFALSMVWDGTNLYLSNRKASGATFANPAYVIEKLNSDDGFDMALVRDGKQLKVYADGGDGALVPIASFTTALDAEGALYAIGYEANKPSIDGCLTRSEVETGRTRQISWANYDGFTEAELADAVAHRYGGALTVGAEP